MPEHEDLEVMRDRLQTADEHFRMKYIDEASTPYQMNVYMKELWNDWAGRNIAVVNAVRMQAPGSNAQVAPAQGVQQPQGVPAASQAELKSSIVDELMKLDDLNLKPVASY